MARAPIFDDPEEYPEGEFVPLHKVFRGIAQVAPHKVHVNDTIPFKVNLNTGECECKHGAAWVWWGGDAKSRPKWIKNNYCVHKLKAMADIIHANDYVDDDEIMLAFVKAVATRYNSYEATSAFHKELRRGDVERAFFFGCVLAAYRGVKGVLTYLSNIVYEETRDHEFAAYITGRLVDKDFTVLTMSKAITWFCETKKKWDLHETRLPIFEFEQKGYKGLVSEFGKAVALPGNIIDEEYKPIFLKKLGAAVRKGDDVSIQYHLKGLQKIKCSRIEDVRSEMLECIYANAKLSGRFPIGKRKHLVAFHKRLRNKFDTTLSLSYHDLNAFADLAGHGEPYGYGVLPESRRTAIIAAKKPTAFPFDRFPVVPLYAHDSHTWRGKALMRYYPNEIRFGVEQTHVDFRGCGAYFGVAWRYYAMAQHGTVRVKWETVKVPRWMSIHLQDMWY